MSAITAYVSSYYGGGAVGAAVAGMFLGLRAIRLFRYGTRIRNRTAVREHAANMPAYHPQTPAAAAITPPAPSCSAAGSVAPPGFTAPPAAAPASPATPMAVAAGPYAAERPRRRRSGVRHTELLWFVVLAFLLLAAAVRFGGTIIGGDDYSGLPAGLHSHEGVEARDGFMHSCGKAATKDFCSCTFAHVVAVPPYDTMPGLISLSASLDAYVDNPSPSATPPPVIAGAIQSCRAEGLSPTA